MSGFRRIGRRKMPAATCRKVTIYLEPMLLAHLQDLANARGVSLTRIAEAVLQSANMKEMQLDKPQT